MYYSRFKTASAWQWHDTGGGGYYCNNYSSSSTTKRELIDFNEVVPELEESTSPKDDDTNGLYTRVTATGLATMPHGRRVRN